MSAAKIGSFDDLLQITDERLRPVARALRKTILDLHPEACEGCAAGRAVGYLRFGAQEND